MSHLAAVQIGGISSRNGQFEVIAQIELGSAQVVLVIAKADIHEVDVLSCPLARIAPITVNPVLDIGEASVDIDAEQLEPSANLDLGMDVILFTRAQLPAISAGQFDREEEFELRPCVEHHGVDQLLAFVIALIVSASFQIDTKHLGRGVDTQSGGGVAVNEASGGQAAGAKGGSGFGVAGVNAQSADFCTQLQIKEHVVKQAFLFFVFVCQRILDPFQSYLEVIVDAEHFTKDAGRC